MEPIQTPDQNNASSKRRKFEKIRSFYRRHSSTIYSVALFGSAFASALLLNAFVFQPYEVKGSSMEPTLQNSDRLIVVKAGKTWSRITNKQFTPSRGDVVVFEQNSLSEQLIKRVVGVPGDRVVVQNGVVTVFNNDNPEGFLVDDTFGVDFFEVTDGLIDTTVEDGTIFVIGDNRLPNASRDSRSFGLIESEDVVGTLALRMYPFNKLDTF